MGPGYVVKLHMESHLLAVIVALGLEDHYRARP